MPIYERIHYSYGNVEQTAMSCYQCRVKDTLHYEPQNGEWLCKGCLTETYFDKESENESR